MRYWKATDASGRVVVLVDGAQLWDVSGNPTALSEQKLFWSVNNYAENISPDPCTIYVDDLEILTMG
jgi:hypothetical protein